MVHALKARRFSTLQMIFAATVLLMIAKAFVLRTHGATGELTRVLGAQAAAETEDTTEAADDDAFARTDDQNGAERE